MHRSSGPAGAFFTAPAPAENVQSPSQAPVAADIASSNPSTSLLDCGPLQFPENECTNFAVDCCATVGSLSSVQSAPPVPLADLTNTKAITSGVTTITSSISTTTTTTSRKSGGVNFEIGHPDSPSRRPISLALDSNGMQLGKASSRPPFNQQPSEADEEDNENLLTVSSLTARPLIAKSRELRTTK